MSETLYARLERLACDVDLAVEGEPDRARRVRLNRAHALLCQAAEAMIEGDVGRRVEELGDAPWSPGRAS